MSVSSPEMMMVGGVIVLLSIIQSCFGMGLLVFGTPTLLLMAYDFPTALSILLPASICISLLQMLNGLSEITILRRYVPCIMVPSLIVGLVGVSRWGSLNFHFVIAVMLLLTAMTRLVPGLDRTLQRRMRHHALLGSAIAGLVHGATNLGGAPLLMLVSGLYRTKHAVRANIAFAYAVMGIIQLVIVAVLHDQMFGIHTVLLALIGVATYLSLGQHLFRRLNEVHFKHLMTLGIIIYGVVLLVTSLNMAG